MSWGSDTLAIGIRLSKKELSTTFMLQDYIKDIKLKILNFISKKFRLKWDI